jgi:hypothetical protein
MLVKDKQESKYVKNYVFRVSESGDLDVSSLKDIMRNIETGFKLTTISGGTRCISIELTKYETIDNTIKF